MQNTQNTQNKIPIDLHCHSDFSDGSYNVKDLLDLIVKHEGKHIALTDHDTVSGIESATTYAKSLNLNLIAGVEISVTWREHLIHIVGLNINYTNKLLNDELYKLRQARIERSKKIAERLESIGIKNSLAGAMNFCKNPENISRTHFMKFLIANNYASRNNAFDKYLAPGKIAYIKQQWATLEQSIYWIRQAGGVAVIAHPCRYKLNKNLLIELIKDFKQLGGMAIEVVTPNHSTNDANTIALIAKEYDLLASLGSDFHEYKPSQIITPGKNYPLPKICKPVYQSEYLNLIIS